VATLLSVRGASGDARRPRRGGRRGSGGRAGGGGGGGGGRPEAHRLPCGAGAAQALPRLPRACARVWARGRAQGRRSRGARRRAREQSPRTGVAATAADLSMPRPGGGRRRGASLGLADAHCAVPLLLQRAAAGAATASRGRLLARASDWLPIAVGVPGEQRRTEAPPRPLPARLHPLAVGAAAGCGPRHTRRRARPPAELGGPTQMTLRQGAHSTARGRAAATRARQTAMETCRARAGGAG